MLKVSSCRTSDAESGGRTPVRERTPPVNVSSRSNRAPNSDEQCETPCVALLSPSEHANTGRPPDRIRPATPGALHLHTRFIESLWSRSHDPLNGGGEC